MGSFACGMGRKADISNNINNKLKLNAMQSKSNEHMKSVENLGTDESPDIMGKSNNKIPREITEQYSMCSLQTNNENINYMYNITKERNTEDFIFVFV